MTTKTAQLIVRLIDLVSGPAGTARNALRGLMTASNAQFGVGLGSLRGQLDRIQTQTQRIKDNATQAVAAAAIPATAAAVSGFQTLVQFSKELNKATAIGELTENQRDSVAKTAREIGAATQFTAQQALQMQRTLIAAGRTVEQAQGMTRPILNAALFGDVDPARAADGIIAVTSAYRLQMRTIEEAHQQAERVGDIVAKASNLSRAQFDDILQGFKYAAPIAKAAGWSMEQLASAIAHMANNGLRGDEAGTALRSMLVRMVKPTVDARQAMAELGMRYDDFFTGMKAFNIDYFASGMANAGSKISKAQQAMVSAAVAANTALPDDQRKDLGEVLTQAMISALNIPEKQVQNRQKIARAVQLYASSLAEGVNPDKLFEELLNRGVTPGQMARIFDARQGSRLMTLLGPEYKEILDKLTKEAPGASARGAAQMERGVYGAFQRALSAVENFVLSVGESGIATALADALDGMAKAINEISKSNPDALRAVGYAIAGLAVGGPALLGLIAASAAVKALAAAGGLVLAAFSPMGAIIAGVAAAAIALSTAIYQNWSGIVALVEGIGEAFQRHFPVAAQAIGYIVAKGNALIAWVASIDVKISASAEQWKAWGNAAVDAVVNAGKAVVDWVSSIPGRIAAAVQTAGTALYEAGAKLIDQLLEGMKSKFNDLMNWVSAIPGRISGAVGGALSFGGGKPAPIAGQRASGGPVLSGKTYLVGERGPELFTAGSSGNIIPNGGRAGLSGGGATINLSPTFNITGADAKEVAQIALSKLKESVQSALRDSHRDVGFGYA